MRRGKPVGESSEDLLTSMAFGLLAWIPASIGYGRFLGRANPPPAWAANLREVRTEFWPWWDEHAQMAGAEPDVVLTVTTREHRRLLLVVECKRKSGKSGEGQRDQLARQAASGTAIAAQRGVSFAGVLYLTEHLIAPSSELEASLAVIVDVLGAEVPLHWLSWRDLVPVLEEAQRELGESATPLAAMASDLVETLARWGLGKFDGFPAPEEPPAWHMVARFGWRVEPTPPWEFRLAPEVAGGALGEPSTRGVDT